jgi:hypothetical protein
MSSPPDAIDMETVARFWGQAYTLSHRPDIWPGKPCRARRKDGHGTVSAATPAALLDAIKDDAAERPFTGGGA